MDHVGGHIIVKSDSARLPLPDGSVDLVFGSPPYLDSRLYLEDGRDLGIARQCQEWIDWMLAVTTEALRVSRGAVVWVASGKTKDRNYQPACEGLMYRWWLQGGHAYRPCYWHRFGIPGSGGDQWFRADVEYVMCFKRPGKLPFSDNTAMGHLPLQKPGGAFSYRDVNGKRRNKLVTTSGYNKEGRPIVSKVDRQVCEIANPGNMISTGSGGGGKLGCDLAH